MTGAYLPRLTATVAMIAAIAICLVSCSSKSEQAPRLETGGTQLSPAAAGSCQIDALKMCQVVGGSASPAAQPSATTSYGPPNLPDSLEFQIPAGQTVKLMCYYDPQHSSVYRADATPEAALTGNSVDYMKKRGFCTNK